MKNADMPAMPMTDSDGMPFNDTPSDLCTIGLTKREYFAALAMQGILVSRPHAGEGYVASQAVNQADTVLAELERQQ